jgi:hypothetical protein
MDQITIALVLKTGGVYDYRYVNNIADAIKENINVPHKIVCLCDDPTGISSNVDEIIPFTHGWPKWWGKIELFKPGLFGDEQVFYFDLDTIIVNNLHNILHYRGEFCALRDFYNLEQMASGMMSWHGDRVFRIYNEFNKSSEHFMRVFEIEGDQAFIRRYKPSIDYFQDILNNKNEVVSYKVHCVKGNDAVLPLNTSVVCFHGNPRPHTISNSFNKYWKQ